MRDWVEEMVLNAIRALRGNKKHRTVHVANWVREHLTGPRWANCESTAQQLNVELLVEP